MELEPIPKREFMARFERYEPLIKDHTSTITAKNCLRKYFYQIVLGFNPKETAPYFTFGSAYHKFREVLETNYATLTKDGASKQDAILNSFQGALEAGIAYFEKHGNDPKPGTQWEFLTKQRLALSAQVAWKHWAKEKDSNRIQVISVEQPFNVQLADGSRRSGRFDQLLKWSGKIWGRDFKTSTKEENYFTRGVEPNDQFTGYTLAESILSGERVEGQLVEVLFNKKDKGPLIYTVITTRSEWQLKQWEREIGLQNRILKICREEDVWPMQEHNCGWCPYHSVCKMPTEAAQMAKLQQEFIVRPWDNTKIGVEE